MDWVDEKGFLDIRETSDTHLHYGVKYIGYLISKTRQKQGFLIFPARQPVEPLLD